MDLTETRRSAERLNDLLERHKQGEWTLEMLHEQLQPLFAAVQKPDFDAVRSVPGGRGFLDGDLAKWPEIEEAYADFKVAAMGL